MVSLEGHQPLLHLRALHLERRADISHETQALLRRRVFESVQIVLEEELSRTLGTSRYERSAALLSRAASGAAPASRSTTTSRSTSGST